MLSLICFEHLHMHGYALVHIALLILCILQCWLCYSLTVCWLESLCWRNFFVSVDCFNLTVIRQWWFHMHRSATQAMQESVVESKNSPGKQESQSYEQSLGTVEKYKGVPCPCQVEYCKYAKNPGDSCGNKYSNDHTYVPALSTSDALCGCGGSFTQKRNTYYKKDHVKKYSHTYRC